MRASTAGVAPIDDLPAAIRREPTLDAADFPVAASQSFVPLDARQLGTGRAAETYPVRGLDDAFLGATTFGLGARARGYAGDERGLARDGAAARARGRRRRVVPAPRPLRLRAVPSDFRLSGFFLEDGGFAPVPVEVTDPGTGRRVRLTRDRRAQRRRPARDDGPLDLPATLAAAFPGRARPTIHYLTTAPGVDPDAAAARARVGVPVARHGGRVDARRSLDDAMAASLTFNRLIQGFMALGLVVGVAALGVISARAVVERRQQIGVLRSIGFRRGWSSRPSCWSRRSSR